jgi:hypothetical protein
MVEDLCTWYLNQTENHPINRMTSYDMPPPGKFSYLTGFSINVLICAMKQLILSFSDISLYKNK